MDAYYACAIDVSILKSEQVRISQELAGVIARQETDVAEWQEILDKAMTFATACGRAYKKASDNGLRLLNQAS